MNGNPHRQGATPDSQARSATVWISLLPLPKPKCGYLKDFEVYCIVFSKISRFIWVALWFPTGKELLIIGSVFEIYY